MRFLAYESVKKIKSKQLTTAAEFKEMNLKLTLDKNKIPDTDWEVWIIISFLSLFLRGGVSHYWLLEQEKVISVSHYIPNYLERTGEAD